MDRSFPVAFIMYLLVDIKTVADYIVNDIIEIKHWRFKMKKAETFYEIQSAVEFSESVDHDSSFFTNFDGFRGEFTEKRILKELNINPKTTEYIGQVSINKKLIFIAGHRGSGKTTELNNIAYRIKNTNCFYPVLCYLDKKGGLDINNIDFVDILIYILDNLAEILNKDGIDIDQKTIESFQSWYTQRIDEINNIRKSTIDISSGAEAGFNIPGIFKLFSKVTASLSGTNEVKSIIRNTFINKFSDFSLKFNQFIEEISAELRKKNIARDIIFIIDGFEKIGNLETIKKILISESNKLLEIKTNMILTLPIELMKEAARINNYGTIFNFPVIKIKEKNGNVVSDALAKFKEFILKRADEKLFAEGAIEKIILLSGGSPRELLRIIQQGYVAADGEQIDELAIDKATQILASTIAPYLTKAELDKLKELKESLKNDKEVPYDNIIQELLEKCIIFEYNDGTHKQVNPIIENSKVYMEYVR